MLHAMLRLACVSKRYGAATALSDVSIDFARGRTTVLIGSSGSGKSTALRMLNALIEPDAGEVLLEGRPLPGHDIQALRRRMGYVIQDGGLFPHLRAGDNVSLLARHLGWAAPDIAARLQALAELAKLSPEMLDRYPRELSGGQQQRVALMRALMLEPEVLLLDEPLGGLDPLVRAELSGDLKGIFGQLGTTVALVTHDLAEAALFADHMALLHAGKVVQQGSMRQLLEAPADPFVRRFVDAQRGMLAHLEGAR